MRLRSSLLASAAPAVLAFALAACSGAAAAPGNGVVTLATPTPAATAPGSPGASEADTGASPSASAPTDPREAMLAYAQCMRDHGVDMPDPVFDGAPGGGGTFSGAVAVGGSGDPVSGAAQEACQPLMAAMTIGDDGPSTMSPEEQQAFLDFAQCMRDHGVDMPDPQFHGGGVMISIGGSGTTDGSGGTTNAGPDPNSTAFQDAQTACQQVLTDAGVKPPGSVSSTDGATNVGGGPVGGPASGTTGGGKP